MRYYEMGYMKEIPLVPEIMQKLECQLFPRLVKKSYIYMGSGFLKVARLLTVKIDD